MTNEIKASKQLRKILEILIANIHFINNPEYMDFALTKNSPNQLAENIDDLGKLLDKVQFEKFGNINTLSDLKKALEKERKKQTMIGKYLI